MFLPEERLKEEKLPVTFTVTFTMTHSKRCSSALSFISVFSVLKLEKGRPQT